MLSTLHHVPYAVHNHSVLSDPLAVYLPIQIFSYRGCISFVTPRAKPVDRQTNALLARTLPCSARPPSPLLLLARWLRKTKPGGFTWF